MNWGKREDILCAQWISADTRQQYRIYNKLYPKMLYMVKMIAMKYYALTPNERWIIDETLNHVFVKLDRYDTSKKSYAFIGTVIKNYINYKILQPKKKNGYPQIIDLSFDVMDDYEKIDIPINQQLELLIEKEEIRRKKVNFSSGIKLKYLNDMLAFYNEYGNLIPTTLVNHLSEKYNIQTGSVVLRLRKYFNFNFYKHIHNERNN